MASRTNHKIDSKDKVHIAGNKAMCNELVKLPKSEHIYSLLFNDALSKTL